MINVECLIGDTIQTQADERAKVQMIDGSLLSVRPINTGRAVRQKELYR